MWRHCAQEGQPFVLHGQPGFVGDVHGVFCSFTALSAKAIPLGTPGRKQTNKQTDRSRACAE
jgi:hypothetical protein